MEWTFHYLLRKEFSGPGDVWTHQTGGRILDGGGKMSPGGVV